MTENVGYATLSIIPSAKGFATALNSQTAATLASAGKAGGAKASAGFGGALTGGLTKLAAPLAAAVGTAAAGSWLKGAVGLEASFSKTMNQMAAVAGVPAKGIKSLSALAMKMGADTTFSAGEAADAMLELAKGGMTAAQIKAGGLKGTLTLAAAGGTDLATAATIASNALNTFGLKGKDVGLVAAALAGGANASSASVESLGEALSQVGPGAKNAGLSLQQTVGVLSAFDAAGIKGSDAGTSLKTMLTRLVPQTTAAKNAMAQLHLNFVNADGSFKSISQVAGELHDKLGGLSAAQKTTALNTIFGSDASRAASVLMNEGAKGVDKYVKATKDKNAAEKVAKASMSGTSGALEQMRGAFETLQLQVGQLLAPVVTRFAGTMTNLVIPALSKTFGFLSQNKSVIGPLAAVVASFAGGVLAVATATKVWTIAQAALDVVLSANPIGLVVGALVALGAGLVLAYKKSAAFRTIVQGAFHGVQAAASAVAGFFTGKLPAAFHALTGAASSVVNGIRSRFSGLVSFIQSIPGKISGLVGKLLGIGKNMGSSLIHGLLNGLKGVGGMVSDLGGAIKGEINHALHLPFTIKGPGPLPDMTIPAFANGGVVNKATLGVFGEAGPEAIMPLSKLDTMLRSVRGSGGGTAGLSVSLDGSALTLVLDDGTELSGYISDIADDRVAANATLTGQTARAA